MLKKDRLVIEPHYLGSLEFFVLLYKYKEVTLEVNQHFTKQTYKNRCYILSSQGKLPLSIPVKFNNRTILKDVKIESNHKWQKDHWGAIYSSYGKSPFFEYFSDSFHQILKKKYTFLLDLNLSLMTNCLDLLQIGRTIVLSESFVLEQETKAYDARETIIPKIRYDKRENYSSQHYNQNFGNEFVPNLSIIDLLFCEGPSSEQVLKKSLFSHIEQF